MIKDLSASLVAAAAAINQKSREAFVAEQKDLQARKTVKMPMQPVPKADPAAVATAKKMAEAVEGTIPKTPKEKELAAKHGHPKRITFGDVLKARGVKAEGWNPIKHIPKEKQTDAIKTAAKDVKRGSYADRAALLKAGGVKEEVEAVDEGLMAKMKQIGKKIVDKATHGSDEDLIKDLQKKVGVPQTGKKPVTEAKNEEKGEKEDSAAHEKAEKKKSPFDTSGPSTAFNKEKSAFTSKKVSTGTVYSRKPVKESEEVQHEQFGLGKTLPGQEAEDGSWIDVMFAEGIKRVETKDLIEAAVGASHIHVSPAGGGKYKVHAVGSKFASGIKVGEHLTDTHLDDFAEMGGKIKHVKAEKKD